MSTVGVDRLLSRRRQRLVLAGALAALVFVAHGVMAASAATVFNTTTTLTANTTWTTAGSPYILNADVYVEYGVLLTVQPGVVVKLNGTSRALRVDGAMSAVGTSASPIVFTSLQDDSVGGDDGGDGPTVGAPGQWRTISFRSGDASSYLRYVDVRFGGAGSSSSDAPLTLGSATTLTIEDSTVRNSAWAGISLFSAQLILRRSSIRDNGTNGIDIAMGSVLADQNTISNNYDTGIKILLIQSYSGAQSILTRNSLTRNGRFGVNLYIDPGVANTRYPKGTTNNIFGNGTDQDQVPVKSAPTPKTPNLWAGNYWGPTAVWWPNRASCAGTSPFAAGYLADTSRPYPYASVPPYGPVTTDLYAAGSSLCNINAIPFNPFDFSLFPIDTALPVGASAGVPTKQTLGPSGQTADGNNPTREIAEPVNSATGSYTRTETDLRLYGDIGIPFSVSRTYNSVDTTNGALGQGWTTNLSASLQIAPSGDVMVRGESGAQLDFVKRPDGSYSAGTGVFSTLRLIAGSYELQRTDQTKLTFDSQGRLTAHVDRNGKGLSLAYDASGRLSQVTDAVNRIVTLSYNATNNLSQIALPDGRRVDYGYTTTAGVTRLTSATDARSKVWTYTYESHGLLETVIDPNSNTVVRNVYGSDGRVTTSTTRSTNARHSHGMRRRRHRPSRTRVGSSGRTYTRATYCRRRSTRSDARGASSTTRPSTSRR